MPQNLGLRKIGRQESLPFFQAICIQRSVDFAINHSGERFEKFRTFLSSYLQARKKDSGETGTTIAMFCRMNLSLKVISALGQATAPLLNYEINGALGLLGALISQFALTSRRRMDGESS